MSAIATTPELRIEVNEAVLSDELAAGLTEVTVVSRLGLPTQCELRFNEPHRDLWNALRIAPGKRLKVILTEGSTLFDGDVTALEHAAGPHAGRQLFVRGYDRLHRLRKHSRLEVHVDMTAEDLARRFTEDTGLDVEAPDAGPLWRHLIQDGVDDAAFLNRIAQRAGLYPHVDAGVLRLVSHRGLGDPIRLVVGETVREIRGEVNADQAADEIFVHGNNPRRDEPILGKTDHAHIGRKAEARARAQDVGGQGLRQLTTIGVEDDTQATAWAQAQLDWRTAAAVTLWARVDGHGDFVPGRKIDVLQLSPHLDGEHVLTEVVHRIHPQEGFVSELSTVPPEPLSVSDGLKWVEAEVTEIDDPQNQGRIRVTLLGYGGLQTDWLRVMTPGAGPDKGLIAQPSIGDRVGVLLQAADPSLAVVIGGLFKEDDLDDFGLNGDHVGQFSFKTPSGHRLTLDEGAHSVELENAEGTRLTLSNEKVILHAKQDLVLEAPGRRLTLKAQNIDFERG